MCSGSPAGAAAVHSTATRSAPCAGPFLLAHPCPPPPLQVPTPLGIGTLKLEDGSSVKGFICEGWVAQAGPPTVREITHLGGWRQFLAAQQEEAQQQAQQA